MTSEISYYPLESCPTRIMHGWDLMSESEWIRANGSRTGGGDKSEFELNLLHPMRKKSKPLTQAQKDKKRRQFLERREIKARSLEKNQ
jgi:hypothetical protein